MTRNDSTPVGELTRLLREHRAGDADAFARLVSLVYDDLRRVAGGQLRRGTPSDTLSATALVHEAYVRLVDETIPWQNRAHFFAIAARAMRRVLIDHARVRHAAKRGGGVLPLALDADALQGEIPADAMIVIDDALTKLGDVNDRLVRVAECRLFAGLTEQETADALGLSVRTVQREWSRARAWLQAALAPSPRPPTLR
jgi:RNA polymerase sigma factor (TIGR02999 family)